ncbi:uncharacterized protein RHIMIDRAFT_206964 [Rhizopus microsporus ATCC 52813]|uniref:Uncharacterized protein n=1 Tax=Rhizopus microsporus ATCC 52813 TaxID=1340429 RepID=A0A2G4SKT7_RHIZD|nr:uncharacterized protein RHIMIDRAFT_206964 [Rhizopus microsporus ATCC 52813]PHZ09397.1 hypothetical protein RHIMIDRAFT_206964 [Rhizopus microsporus ATCC 52813]
MNRLEQIALDPRFHEALSVLKGFRNGVVYGAKVRFPHTLVMTILFKTGSESFNININTHTAFSESKVAFLQFYNTIYTKKRQASTTFLSGNSVVH